MDLQLRPLENLVVSTEKKKRKHHKLYIPWYTSDADLYDEEDKEEDSWINYIRRNMPHTAGEESPFPYSSWSYTRHDSPFEKDDEDALGKRSDTSLMEDATEALYHHPQIDASEIKIIVLNGIICLFGTVKSLLERREAERIIKDLPGVWSVRNELSIEESQKRSLVSNG